MIFKKLNDYIYDDDRDIKDRLFVLSICTIIGVLLISTIAMFFTESNPAQFVTIIFMMLAIGAMGMIFVKTDKVNVGSIVISVILNFILFPATFIFGGALKGPGPAWFIFNIVFNYIVLTGKLRIIISVFEEIIGLVCYILAYTHPDVVSEMTGVAVYIFSFIAILFIYYIHSCTYWV